MDGSIDTAALAGVRARRPTRAREPASVRRSTTTPRRYRQRHTRDSAGSGNGLVGRSLTVPGRYVPTEMQWNPYAPSNYAQADSKAVFDPFLRDDRKTGELIPSLFRDWTLDDPLAFVPHNPWYDAAEKEYVRGRFVWSGVDYLGEARDWPNQRWVTGLIDTTGAIKPSGRFHQTAWSDEPTVFAAAVDPARERPVARPGGSAACRTRWLDSPHPLVFGHPLRRRPLGR